MPHPKQPLNNSDTYQIILGTLLGSGFITKDNRLNIQHPISKEIYMIAKTLHLQEYATQKSLDYRGGIIRWRSKKYDFWDDYRDIKQNLSMQRLDHLHAISLAVWFQDSGILIGYKKRNACLRTQSFGKTSNETILQYFNEVGLPCNMQKERKSFVIVFDTTSTQQFLKIVAPFVHPTLRQKLLVTG